MHVASILACACTYTLLYAFLSPHMCMYYVCVPVLQHQILLSQLSASLGLVLICLPLHLQPLLLLHFVLFPEFFIAVPLFSNPLLMSVYLFFLTASFSFFSVAILLLLHPDALCISLAELFLLPFFFWNAFKPRLHSGCLLFLNLAFLFKYSSLIFFPSNFFLLLIDNCMICGYVMEWNVALNTFCLENICNSVTSCYRIFVAWV